MSILKKIRTYFEPRIKNKGFWLSIFAIIPLVIECFFDKSIIPANYEQITNTVLSVLVIMGIVNNPKDGVWYKDDPVSDEERVTKVIDNTENVLKEKVSERVGEKLAKETTDKLIDDLLAMLKEIISNKNKGAH